MMKAMNQVMNKFIYQICYGYKDYKEQDFGKLYKNVLCLLTKRHGLGIQIDDERLLDSGNRAYQQT